MQIETIHSELIGARNFHSILTDLNIQSIRLLNQIVCLDFDFIWLQHND